MLDQPRRGPGRPPNWSRVRSPAGDLTEMEKRFVHAVSRTGDYTYGAWAAGYAKPQHAGWLLKQKARVVSAIRAETQRYLLEEAGELSVRTLAEGCGAEAPWNIRIKAASKLADLANIAVTDEEADKRPSELTAGELGSMVNLIHQRLLERRTIEHQPLDVEDYEDTGDNDVFA